MRRSRLGSAGSRSSERRRRFRPRLEVLEDRSVPTVSIINGGGLGYVGNGGGGPPDVTGAAGPSSYLEITNSTVTLFSPKLPRTILAQHSIGDFFYNPAIGNETPIDGGSCGVCDSTGIFDNLMGANGRFIIGDIDIDATTNVGQYIFAVSTSSNPTTFTTADWNFYHITTTQTVGGTTNWTDYPGNPGFNADAFVETFNLAHGGFLTGNAEIVSVNATDLANGVPQASLHFYQNFSGAGGLALGTFSYRATTMHDSVAGDPMWLIQNPEDGTDVDVYKMTPVLSSSATFTKTSLALPAADNFQPSLINNPLNPNQTAITDGDVDNPDDSPMSDVDNRFLKAGEFNNTVVAAQKVAVGTASIVSARLQVIMGVPQGGSGYTVGDILTVTGGTFTTAAQLMVATTGAGGSVGTVTVATPGSYSSFSGITGAVTGGGSGAKFSFNTRGELDVQWYAFDVSSGTPAFQLVGGNPNVGRIGFGPNTYSVEPAIDINSSGQIGLGFMESDTLGGAVNAATGGFISTFVTARQPTDAAGTMQNIVLVPAGTGSGNISGRIGDFSGMNVDPVNGTFWHTNEFGGGGPTDIANFTLDSPPVVTAPADQMAVEGASQSFALGSFADPDGGPWSVDVNWGDGTAHTVFPQAAAGTITAQSHTYGEEGSYTVTVKVTDTFEGQFDSKTFKVTVSDPAVSAMGVPVNLIAGAACGAGVTTPIATFNDAGGAEPNAFDGGALGNHYKVVSIDWGDASPLDTATGSITFSGTPGSKTDKFNVGGSHTYMTPGTYTITIKLDHEGMPTTVMTSAMVVDLNKAVQTNQTKPTNWLAGSVGQQMVQSFGLTVGGQTLGQWLASSFPRLYGGVAGAPNLSGFTNAQVASFFANLFKSSPTPMLDSEVLATAIYVFTTTKSLGGNVGLAYGFSVTDPGLGAADQNVNQHGQAFFVPNFTTLNICKILSIANNTASGGHPWGSSPWDANATLRNDALAIFLLINQEKWY
jgi:hypothetical protein